MSLIDRRHMFVNLEAQDAADALRKIGSAMVETGYVKSSYPDALVNRERDFPTGLDLKFNTIAMPHTDPQHVNRPAIALAKLAHPVTFMHMGSTGEQVAVQLIFMMAITDPDAQIKNLRRVMKVFMNRIEVHRDKQVDIIFILKKQNK